MLSLLSAALFARLVTARECGGELIDARTFEIDLIKAKDCHAVLFDELSLGNAGMQKVAAALDSMPMDILSLHGNGIADAGAVALAGVLERDRHAFTELFLDSNKIGDEGFAGASCDRHLGHQLAQHSCFLFFLQHWERPWQTTAD